MNNILEELGSCIAIALVVIPFIMILWEILEKLSF